MFSIKQDIIPPKHTHTSLFLGHILKVVYLVSTYVPWARTFSRPF